MKFGRRTTSSGSSPIERARALIDADQLDEASEILEAALDNRAGPDAAMLLLAGRTRLQAGDPNGAARWFERFTTAFPDRHEGAVGLAECDEARGHHSAALQRWRALRDEFGDLKGPAWRRRVQANLFRLGRYEELEREVRDEFASSDAAQRFLEVTTNPAEANSVSLAYRHVLIVTYGRSGSTLLQGVLNSIPGMLVRGENGNVFVKFFEIAEHMRSMRTTYPHAFTANRAWFGISGVSDATVLEALRASARSILIGDLTDEASIACLGFKEIRYDELGDRLADYLDFLQELLPECALVFNTRDLGATSRSGWWRESDAAEVQRRLADVTRRFDEYAAGRSNCFAIRYEDVTSKNQRLRELFAFLGADYDDDRVEAVLSHPHSFGPSQPEVKALMRED